MKRKYLIITAIIMALSMILSACSSGKSSGSSSSGDSKKVPTLRIAYMPDIHGAAPLVIAQKKGYFKDAGIKVKLVKFDSGPPEFAAMASGDIDIAYIGPGATFLAAQGKGNIIAVDSLNTGDMVLATKKSGISSIKGLKGKTIGVPKGTSGDMVLNLALKNAGLKETDVKKVNMDVSGAVSAFIANKVDAVAIWSPFTNEIEKKVGKSNMVKLADDTNFFPDYVFPQSWVANPKYLKSNKENVIKFLEALGKANNYRSNHTDEAVKLTSDFTGVDQESLKVQVTTTQFMTSKDIAAKMKDGTAKKWFENLEKLFVENGSLDKVVDGNDFISPDLYQKALNK
ncbi:lipoprotein [Pullulanibacillus camelliae]|uniref:Lipoprotein n=1 Tax=Pullulanibacillus camelliae TaxID=1707096 RepID=A0A8J2VGF6_9BACL|nr:aliphatic sulfonate ABC transporter substrate-binding protein [Pullulanibacillus camelliae]GGE26000.1 lipoprotein [Pullulanibacillus camelliae]